MSDIIIEIVEHPIEVKVLTAMAIGESVTTPHNNLTGLQGGTTDEYYHLTQTQHTNFGDPTQYLLKDGSRALTADWAANHAISGIDALSYDTTYTPTGLEPIGTRYWDAANKTTTLVLPNDGFLQDGQEVYMLATNLSGVDVTDGKAVSVYTATGNRIAFTLTDVTNRFLAAACIGLTTEPIAKNATGRITILGQVHTLNTSGFTEGQYVYVDPDHPGELIATLPEAPDYKVAIGVVEVVHATEGIIIVRPLFIPKLTGLSDVDPTGLNTTGQILSWDQTNSKWVVTAGGGGGTTNHADLSNLSYASAGHTGFEPTVTKGNLTAGSTKISIGGTGTGAVIGTGASVDVAEGNLTHNNLGGLNIGDYQHLTAAQVSALHPAITISDTATIDLTLATQALSADIKADSINDTHIDWGTGTNQVSAADLPIADSANYYVGTETESALAIIGKSRSISAHYSGFPNQTDTALSWNDGTYTLTLTASADSIWIAGVEYTIDTLTKSLTAPQEAISGVYWFWITAPAGVPQLNADITAPGFDKCLVASVYWNTTTNKGILSNERHWFGRDQKYHEYLHETIGARYALGMAGTFTDTTVSIANGEFYDEDIEHIFTTQTTVKVLYHNGDADWAWDILTTPYKVVNPGVDSNLRYNNGNALATVTNNKYVNEWVFSTPDETHPIHVIIGTAEYNTIALARAASLPSFGALTSPETKLIYKIIYQNNGGSPLYIEAVDFRSSSNLPTGNYIPTSHTALSNLDYATANHSGFEPTVTKGNLTEATSAVLTISNGTGAVIGSGTSLQVAQASTSTAGYLSSTDWNTFNGKQAALSLGNLTAGSTKITIGGTGTGAVIGVGVSVDVAEANINHNALSNTHNLTTDINHASITGAHNLTSDINHTAIANIGTNSHSTIDSFISSKAAASGLASLDGSSLVVQNPANATATPTASKIPIADGSGKLDAGWIPAVSGSLPRGYNSLTYVYKDAATVTVAANGQAVTADGSVTHTLAAATDVSLATDLDTGSESANTLYYLWIGTVTGTVTLKFSTSATSPTGLTNPVRLRGAVRNDNSSDILPFLLSERYYTYEVNLEIEGSDVTEVLDATVSTTFVDIDCSGFVPSGKRQLLLIYRTASATTVYIRNNGSSLTSGLVYGDNIIIRSLLLATVGDDRVLEIKNSSSRVTRVSVYGYEL